jgi:hypothetical protein
MLSVCVRHRKTCKYSNDPTSKRCPCVKWLVGTLPGRVGRFRTSAKTSSWEQAEGIARQYEGAAAGGKDMEAAMSLPTVKDAVETYLADARGLVDDTVRKLTTIFEKQLNSLAKAQYGIPQDICVEFLSRFRLTTANS